MSVPTKSESELREALDEAVRRMERAFATCPPVDASADSESAWEFRRLGRLELHH